MLLFDRLISLAGVPKGWWLDLGCGDMAAVRALRRLGCQAVGADLEPQSDEVIKADMCSLPFENSSFDGMIAECSISLCKDANAAFSESFRCLKRGGSLLVSDVFFPAPPCPDLSLGQPATADAWLDTAGRAGFEAGRLIDISDVWREYVLRQLWDGIDLKSMWRQSGDFKNSGYFLFHLIKQ